MKDRLNITEENNNNNNNEKKDDLRLIKKISDTLISIFKDAKQKQEKRIKQKKDKRTIQNTNNQASSLTTTTPSFLSSTTTNNNSNQPNLTNDKSFLPYLPNEVLYEIFGYLNYAQLNQMKRVCSRFLTLASEPALQANANRELDLRHFIVARFPKLDSPITAIHQASDNEIAVGTKAGTLYLLDYRTRQITLELKNAHKESIRCIEKISKNIIATGSDDCSVRFWDIQKHSCIKTLKLVAPAVKLAAYSTNKIAISLYPVKKKNDALNFKYNLIQPWNYETGKKLISIKAALRVTAEPVGDMTGIGETVIGYSCGSVWDLNLRYNHQIHLINGSAMTPLTHNIIACGDVSGHINLINLVNGKRQVHTGASSYRISTLAKFSDVEAVVAYPEDYLDRKLVLLNFTKSQPMYEGSNIFHGQAIPLPAHRHHIKHLAVLSHENNPTKQIVTATGGPKGRLHLISFSFLNNSSNPRPSEPVDALNDHSEINPVKRLE